MSGGEGVGKGSAEAAESIGARIKAFKVETAAAVEAAAKTTQAIRKIQDNHHVIAAAMEEQTTNARHIGSSLDEAAERTSDIARQVAGFATTAEKASAGAQEMRRAPASWPPSPSSCPPW